MNSPCPCYCCLRRRLNQLTTERTLRDVLAGHERDLRELKAEVEVLKGKRVRVVVDVALVDDEQAGPKPAEVPCG